MLQIDPRNPRPGLALRQLLLHKAYTAVVITRSPVLTVGQQEIALLTIALVTACEQLMESKYLNVKHARAVCHMLHTLRWQIGAVSSQFHRWAGTGEEKKALSGPSHHFRNLVSIAVA